MATPEPEDPAHQGGPIIPAVASPEAIKEEFITQRMRTWLTKEQCILPHHDGLAKFYAMRTDTSKATPEAKDVLAISCEKGYRFISLDDRPNTDPQLKERIETLGKWCANPANKHILVEIEALLVQEVQDKVWWLPEEEEKTILKLGILERVSTPPTRTLEKGSTNYLLQKGQAIRPAVCQNEIDGLGDSGYTRDNQKRPHSSVPVLHLQRRQAGGCVGGMEISSLVRLATGLQSPGQ